MSIQIKIINQNRRITSYLLENTYFESQIPQHMSNYLFVAGNFQHVEKLKEYFEEELGSGDKDSSFQKISDEKSIFIIERRNDCVKSSIINQNSGESVFFRGQALDHETSSMILGINGFADFQIKHHEYLNPNQIADFEGIFVLARWNESKLTIQMRFVFDL